MTDVQCPACHHFVVDGVCENPACGARVVTKTSGPTKVPGHGARSGRSFPARFPGNCHSCGARFSTDDPIGFRDDDLCCEACLDSTPVAEKPLEVCQRCFTAKATNGTCMCDD